MKAFFLSFIFAAGILAQTFPPPSQLSRTFGSDNWNLRRNNEEVKPIEQLSLQSFTYRQGRRDSFGRDSRNFLLYAEAMVSASEELHANFGQRMAENLLAHPERIPKKWRRYEILFPGTEWVNTKHGWAFVPVMQWNRDHKRWKIGYYRIVDLCFYSTCRVLK